MAKILRMIGYGWVSLVALSIVISIIGTYFRTQSLYETWLLTTEMMSPFNLIFYGTIFVLALPGMLMLMVAGRLQRRKDRISRG